MFICHTPEVIAKNQTSAERSQSDQFGRRLPLAGTDYQARAALFDGGFVS